jgi:hypothetical protein
MEACVDVKANTIWFDHMYDGEDDMENADFPSAECLIKRRVFLESLARAVSGPRNLEFKKILDLDQTDTDNQGSHSIGSCWLWNLDSYMMLGDLNTDKVLQEHPVQNSSSSLFISVLATKWPYNALERGRIMATHHILNTLYRNEPFAYSKNQSDEGEPFVLRYDDLDFQNIFCDPETGEVTGIRAAPPHLAALAMLHHPSSSQ